MCASARVYLGFLGVEVLSQRVKATGIYESFTDLTNNSECECLFPHIFSCSWYYRPFWKFTFLLLKNSSNRDLYFPLSCWNRICQRMARRVTFLNSFLNFFSFISHNIMRHVLIIIGLSWWIIIKLLCANWFSPLRWCLIGTLDLQKSW